MSDTLKDRPAWVKLNDPRTPRVMQHDHRYQMGRKYYRTEYVRDEHGNFIYEDKTVVHKGYTHRELNRKKMAELGLKDDEAWAFEEDYPELFYFTVIPTTSYRYREYKTERVLVREAPDHCTAEEAPHSHLEAMMAPCSFYPLLPGTVFNNEHSNRSKQHFSHRRARARFRDSIKQYTKLVNSAEAWDDLDDSEVPAFTLRERWSWDD